MKFLLNTLATLLMLTTWAMRSLGATYDSNTVLNIATAVATNYVHDIDTNDLQILYVVDDSNCQQRPNGCDHLGVEYAFTSSIKTPSNTNGETTCRTLLILIDRTGQVTNNAIAEGHSRYRGTNLTADTLIEAHMTSLIK